MPGSLQLGRIVWAAIADANGIPKLRPVVIVTPSDRITPTAPLDVIAVTSRVPEPLPDDHVLLPWHAQGHPLDWAQPQVCCCLHVGGSYSPHGHSRCGRCRTGGGHAGDPVQSHGAAVASIRSSG
jgi:hypothetical protein